MSDMIRTALRREIARLEAALAALDGDFTGPVRTRSRAPRPAVADLEARRARVLAAVGDRSLWGDIIKALPDLHFNSVVADIAALVRHGKVTKHKEDGRYRYSVVKPAVAKAAKKRRGRR